MYQYVGLFNYIIFMLPMYDTLMSEYRLLFPDRNPMVAHCSTILDMVYL